VEFLGLGFELAQIVEQFQSGKILYLSLFAQLKLYLKLASLVLDRL